MSFLIGVLLLTTSLAMANPIEKKNLSSEEEPAETPGTKMPIKKLNTAPTPLPSENHSDSFRGILKKKERS